MKAIFILWPLAVGSMVAYFLYNMSTAYALFFQSLVLKF